MEQSTLRLKRELTLEERRLYRLLVRAFISTRGDVGDVGQDLADELLKVVEVTNPEHSLYSQLPEELPALFDENPDAPL